MTKLKSKLIKDGNSSAIRLPKTALSMSGISGDVDLIVRKGEIIIKKSKPTRQSWEMAIINDKPKPDKELDDWDIVTGEALN